MTGSTEPRCAGFARFAAPISGKRFHGVDRAVSEVLVGSLYAMQARRDGGGTRVPADSEYEVSDMSTSARARTRGAGSPGIWAGNAVDASAAAGATR